MSIGAGAPLEVTAPSRETPSTHPLDRWVDGVRRRSNSAFAALYEATADDLVSFAYGMLRERAAAEDAVQQAFLELVRAAGRFRGNGEALRVWLFKSVRYRCLDELKRAGRRRERPSHELPDQPVAAHHDPGLEPALERALDALSDKARTMIILRHVVGLSGEEIAAVVGLRRPTVYKALERAEARLRVALEEPA